MSIVAIDLFSGSGGTTVGLKKAGVKVVGAVEIDKIACKTYNYNNPEVHLINDDIKNVKSGQLKSLVKNNRLLLVACPPCQGFSSIRNGGENDIRNELVFEYLRLIIELQPDFLLMENVAGMSKGKGKKIFSKFTKSIAHKYEFKFDVLNAADYGVPQIRRRLVLHGVRKDIVQKHDIEVQLPMKTHSQSGQDGLKKWINASVILGLPKIDAGESYEDPKGKILNHVACGLSDLNKQRIRFIRKHGGNRDSLPQELTKNWKRNLSGHTDVYGILDITKPSITMTGGCMTYSKGRFGHPFEDRALSAREAARLQSFDDSYVFFGNKNQLARQIGNAVPVKLSEASGKIFKKIDEELRENVKERPY